MVNWKKENLRDLLALGSWLFFLIVLARAMIEPYLQFVNQLVISGLFLVFSNIFIKNANFYLSRILVLVFFTSLFYNEIKFSIFVSIIFLISIYASFVINKNIKQIIYGIILGILAIVLAYFLSL